jgi:hypothetical protein
LRLSAPYRKEEVLTQTQPNPDGPDLEAVADWSYALMSAGVDPREIDNLIAARFDPANDCFRIADDVGGAADHLADRTASFLSGSTTATGYRISLEDLLEVREDFEAEAARLLAAVDRAVAIGEPG